MSTQRSSLLVLITLALATPAFSTPISPSKILVYEINSKILASVENDAIAYEFYERMAQIEMRLLMAQKPRLLATHEGQKMLMKSRQKVADILIDLMLLSKIANEHNIPIALDELEIQLSTMPPKPTFLPKESKADFEDYQSTIIKKNYLHAVVQDYVEKKQLPKAKDSAKKFEDWYAKTKQKTPIVIQHDYIPKTAGLPMQKSIEIPVRIDAWVLGS